MTAVDPQLAAVPDHVAVFPLTGALLLPHARLPLNIFEPRYLAMTEDALANGRLIGMVQPNQAEPAGPNGPALHRVGCIGRLVSFAETDDGRYLITLGGMIRFAILEEVIGQRGYRRVRADVGPFIHDLDPLPEDDGDTGRAVLLTALRGYFDRLGLDANWTALEQMPHAALVATLCMGCPFDPLDKQALLEAADPVARAATLQALLDFARHGPGQPPAGGRLQ